MMRALALSNWFIPDLWASIAVHSPLPPSPESLDECQQILGYVFRDQALLICCLTHASAAKTRLASNERIEFLGDAILGAVVCEALYEQFPESPEGELTRIKSVVVSRATCARIVRQLQLDQFLVLGKGISHHQPVPDSILATAFEAIIGGIYLDAGYETAREFVIRIIQQDIIQAAESSVGVNYKSLFQQHTQKANGETPLYVVVDETGPDHSKKFLIQAIVGDRRFHPAWGPSKKRAEQHAAHNALSELNGEALPHPTDVPDPPPI